MELRQLRYFLALADELHFGRAAERERIGQSALSLQVTRLEAELGVKLFVRTTRRVRLTEAGRSILASTRLAVRHAEAAQEIARLAAEGQRGRLRVTYAMAADCTEAAEVTASFRDRNPDVAIEQRVDYEAGVGDALCTGSADVGFLWMPAEPQPDLPAGLVAEPQLVEPVVVLCAASHLLARSRTVDAGQLARETLVLPPRDLAPALWSLVPGNRPAFTRQEPSYPAILRAVRREGAVALAPACITESLSGQDVVHRIYGRPPMRLTLWLTWRQDEASPLLESFLAHSRAMRESALEPGTVTAMR